MNKGYVDASGNLPNLIIVGVEKLVIGFDHVIPLILRYRGKIFLADRGKHIQSQCQSSFYW